MNRDRMIKLTVNVAIIAIVLLIYWVFTFVSITVFDLKVFKENITESFYLSVLGILALLAGGLIVNLILNLTKIAETLAERGGPPRDAAKPAPRRRRWLAPFVILSFPMLFLALWLGNHASEAQKRRYLVEAARSVAETYAAEIAGMGDYSFNARYVNATGAILGRMAREDENFPSVSLILEDDVGRRKAFLEFSQNEDWVKDVERTRQYFIFSSSAEEKEYLARALDGRESGLRFSAEKGNYELYYPVKTPKRVIVLRFSDRSEYGKLGS